jgi:probable aminopeptidase NPEPL1
MSTTHHDDRWRGGSTLKTIETNDDCDAARRTNDAKWVVVGAKDALLENGAFARRAFGTNERAARTFERLVESLDANATRSTVLETASEDDEGLLELVACVMPEKSKMSRHNSPIAAHAMTAAAKAAIGDRKKRRAVVLAAVDEEAHCVGALAALARISAPYTNKFRAADAVVDGEVYVGVVCGGEIWNGAETRSLPKAVRRCQALVDMAPNELSPDAFVDEAKVVAGELGASVKVVEIKRYAQLVEEGYGCLAGVGSASSRDGRDPALVHLRFTPKGCVDPDAPSIAFVGKGITFDTGGLSLKSKDGMCGMKTDMGGAAGMLCAFESIAREDAESNFKTPLDLVLCIAENAIGSGAIRPDDILVGKSGKTVEINNTDAEGRLVLADGVAYCSDPANAACKPRIIVDMATLTGAQMIATGRKHAGLVTDSEDMEHTVVRLGRITGDLAHALPYAPEMFKSEFSSKVADMKNSVADRANAQSSCAGQFIANHLHPDWVARDDTAWIHLDMAGPGNFKDGLGSGYGVALLNALYKEIDSRPQ